MQQHQLIAGDSLNFVTEVTGHPASDGWTLKYRLAPFSSAGQPIDIDSVASGSLHLVQMAPNITAAWAPGQYSWASWVEPAAEIYTIATGQITVLSDPRQAQPGYDSRSIAQRALADCEAAMATFNATGGKIKKYEIAGRSQEFQTIGDLMTLHSFWRVKVATEGTAQSIASGMGNPRNLFVRFGRPG